MRRALEYAASLPGAIVAQHAEDETLAAGGHMHEGAWSSRLGIPGRPSVAETVIVARDIELCRGHRHPRALPALLRGGHRRPRARGQGTRAAGHGRVRAPPLLAHRRVLRRASIPMFKVHPPLRTEADVEAIREGLADGTIDAIATDHAPHTPESKERPFEEAPPGMLGLETALAVTLTELVEPGDPLPFRCPGPALLAPCRDRGPRGARRPGRAGRRREPHRLRPRPRVGRGPGSAGEPRSEHALRRARACGARSSTPSSPATSSCVTGRRPDDRRAARARRRQ